MRYKKLYILLIVFLYSLPASAQGPDPSLGFWHIKRISGELSLLGSYRSLSTQLNELSEEQLSQHLLGGIRINTANYLWNPDIISINIGGEYNPELRNERYLVVPDRAEQRTLSKLDILATVFNDKAINLSTYINLNNSYFNRENLTNVRSDNKQWGASFGLRNKYLPVKISYRDMSWKQTETESGRQFSMEQQNFEASTIKSFFGNDKHELKYSLREYQHQYSELSNIRNKVSRINFISQVFLDRERKYSLNSNIAYYDQHGTYTFAKTEANERLVMHLPARFDLNANYAFHKINDPAQTITVNRTSISLSHKLFESLTSRLYTDYVNTAHSLYNESSLISGARIDYTKLTPIGRVNFGYQYYIHNNHMEGETATIVVLREEHVLNDAEVSILKKPYTETSSIIITDISSTIIYQEGLDYIITEINNFAEILRIPGGQISQNQTVLISYSAIQPGNYSYLSSSNTLTGSLMIFDRLIEVYYRGSAQNYNKVKQTEYLTLNRFYQNIAGIRLYYKFATAGAEYDYYNSDLIPYKRFNYYLNLNLKIKSRMLLSLNGTVRDYKVIDTEVKHLYTNISTRFTYSINNWSKLNVEGGYLNQNGSSIDLNLISGKTEIIATVRKLTLRGSFSIYKRAYARSDFFYTGTNLEISRKF